MSKNRQDYTRCRLSRRTICFAEPLVVYDLALSEELQYIAHIPVVDEAQEVVVGYARFLLCCIFISTTV